MGKYKKDLDFLNRVGNSLDYIVGILMEVNDPEYKAYISLIYLTGARPSEMQLLRKENLKETGKNYILSIPTAKRGFPRTLIFDKGKTPLFSTLISPFWGTLNARDMAFKKDISTYKKMIYRVSENSLTPYSFRHHRMTKLAELGANTYELKYWKGAKKMESVEPYIHYSGKMVERFKGRIR